ncbi:hypothetical protein ATANTOWER_008199 [Ataeniobius toweri]|uniref:C-type lectin domain-containing protein n=1 Tax=Ataeniobius toweri TaxID=208326 RepID=A0ABU7BGE6_9TELE|nr:hypothetical protein [Ataeniobius toweri]
MEEEDVTYTTVVFKTKKPLQPEVQKKEEETVYDEVKVRSEATEKPGTNPKKEEEIVYDELKACSEKNQHTLDMNASAELLLDKKEDDRRRWYQQLAWCLGTLFVSLLLGVIAVCIYFASLPNSGISKLDQLKTNQTALLEENNNLTNLNNKLTADFENLRIDHSNLTIRFDSLVEAFNVSESRIANLTTEKQKLATQNQKLESERRNLTEQIQNLETRWNEQNVSRAQWSIDAYCPKANKRTCSPCPDGWLVFQSSCYAVNNAGIPHRKTWEEARKDCREKSSDLVVVFDESEKSFVNEKSWGSSQTQGYWVGLKAEGNKWKWLNGSNLTNNNWIPQNANDGQCVISTENQGWKSVQCNTSQQWICEKDALSV